MLTRESERQFESLNVVRDQTLQIPNEYGTGCLVCGFSLGLFLHSFWHNGTHYVGFFMVQIPITKCSSILITVLQFYAILEKDAEHRWCRHWSKKTFETRCNICCKVATVGELLFSRELGCSIRNTNKVEIRCSIKKSIGVAPKISMFASNICRLLSVGLVCRCWCATSLMMTLLCSVPPPANLDKW